MTEVGNNSHSRFSIVENFFVVVVVETSTHTSTHHIVMRALHPGSAVAGVASEIARLVGAAAGSSPHTTGREVSGHGDGRLLAGLEQPASVVRQTPVGVGHALAEHAGPNVERALVDQIEAHTVGSARRLGRLVVVVVVVVVLC